MSGPPSLPTTTPARIRATTAGATARIRVGRVASFARFRAAAGVTARIRVGLAMRPACIAARRGAAAPRARLAWRLAAPARLGVVRIALFAIWLIVVVRDPLGYLAELPPAQGVGVFRWLPEASTAWLGPFKILLVVTLVACLVGAPGFRAWIVAAAALLTVHQALLRNFTFVNHEELAALITTWILAAFGTPGRFALHAASAPSVGAAPPTATGAARTAPADAAVAGRSAPPDTTATDRAAQTLWAMAVFLLLPYTLIAAHRLAYAAPDVFTGESLPYWLASLDSLDRDGWSVGIWALGHPAVVAALKVGFCATTIVELLAPLCLLSAAFARFWALAVAGFHVVNEFTLNLFFWQNAVLVILLVGWSAAPPRGRRAGGS